MTYITILLTLMSASTYFAAEVTLTQPATESVTPGSTVTLPCTLSGYSISDRYVYWFQQKDGNRPRYLLYYDNESSKHQGDGIPDRFSGSKDTSKNAGYLTIKGALSEDEAVYYCAIWHTPSSTWIFGPGTPLNIITGEAKSPLMSIYPPSEEELKTGKSSTVCLGMDYTPGSATIQWTVDGATQTAGVSPISISRQSNDRYSASSVLSLSSSDYEKYKQIACTMTHQGKSFVQILKTSECN